MLYKKRISFNSLKKLDENQASGITQKLILLERYGHNLGPSYRRNLTKDINKAREILKDIKVSI